MDSIYDRGLDKNEANFVALTPLSFVERSAEVFADLPAVIHGARRYTWAQVRERSARLAAALRALGVRHGSTVSAMLPNTPEMVEAHYAVPALGAVLNTLNTRLDAPLVAWQMNHCEAAVLITDREFAPVMAQALRILREEHGRNPTVIDVADREYTGPGELVGTLDYEAVLAAHEPLAVLPGPRDEWDAIAVSYTSGITGDPKGVVTHHRGACLNAVCNAATWTMPHFPRSMIEGMASIGFDITHVYGLTEVYGPAAVAVQRPSWSAQSLSDQTRLNGRQGVRYALQEGMTVLQPETLEPLPADGETMGEIMFRGNIVMKGYLKNLVATAKAFEGGWFHTGDLAVMESDRYVKIKDRSKDIIISGGENISSIEVEDALYRHPAVLTCAVVARPDAKWGETPLAFVELRPDATVSAEEPISHCRTLLASYKAPREVRFEAIPKTSTGKSRSSHCANAPDRRLP